MGAYLSSPVKDKESEEHESDRYQYGVSAMQGWRTTMEDAHLAEVDLDGAGAGLFGVFDGHGGREVALFTARHIKAALMGAESFRKGDYGEALKECYVKLDEMMTEPLHMRELNELKAEESDDEGTELMNSAIMKIVREQLQARLAEEGADGEERPITLTLDPAALLSQAEGAAKEEGPGTTERIEGEGGKSEGGASGESEEDKGFTQAGCTAVCALVIRGKLVVANAGDSRAVLCRGGTAVALTQDHKPTDDAEMRRIVRAGGEVRDGRVNGALNLSRALGDMEYKLQEGLKPEEQMITAVPEVRVMDLTKDDEFVLLACDGIWDVMENQEAVDFVRERLGKGMSPKDICEEMCDHCLAPDTSGPGHGCDNMTAMIVRLKDPVKST